MHLSRNESFKWSHEKSLNINVDKCNLLATSITKTTPKSNIRWRILHQRNQTTCTLQEIKLHVFKWHGYSGVVHWFFNLVNFNFLIRFFRIFEGREDFCQVGHKFLTVLRDSITWKDYSTLLSKITLYQIQISLSQKRI